MISVVNIEGVGWFHLSRGRTHWVLRNFSTADGTGVTYQRGLVDYPVLPVRIIEDLSFDEVQQRTGKSPHRLSVYREADRRQWREILDTLSHSAHHVGQSLAPTLVPPVTDMYALYSVLLDFNKRDFQLAMVREAARPPVCERLAQRFRASVEQFSHYNNSNEPFRPDNRAELHAQCTGTHKLTHLLIANCEGLGTVSNDSDLDFVFVDREINPARATASVPGKRLDWLLANKNDKRLIVAEVKCKNDRNPFVALVQALMYAAELVTDSQRTRLAQHYPERFSFPDDDDSAVADIYIVLDGYDWENNEFVRLFAATQRICKTLMAECNRSPAGSNGQGCGCIVP
jgi:hypothetical protein